MRDRRSQALNQAADDYRRAAEQLRRARRKLIAEIRAAHAAGERQVDIVRDIHHIWTREYIRRLVMETDRRDDNGPPP